MTTRIWPIVALMAIVLATAASAQCGTGTARCGRPCPAFTREMNYMSCTGWLRLTHHRQTGEWLTWGQARAVVLRGGCCPACVSATEAVVGLPRAADQPCPQAPAGCATCPRAQADQPCPPCAQGTTPPAPPDFEAPSTGPSTEWLSLGAPLRRPNAATADVAPFTRSCNYMSFAGYRRWCERTARAGASPRSMP